MTFQRFAISIAEPSPYVERATPGGAPTAFRIWGPGENKSDDGPTFFTERSAALLMAEQDARGRAYPSDFDHLSLVSNRPAEAGRASGYHRLQVRTTPDGPELWAVDIEWCADAKAGLEEQPPRWKYFSPAFKDDTKTHEVTGYLNFALCINPKTHDLPALAGHTETRNMNKKDMRAFLATMAAHEGCSDDEKKAYATIAAALGDDGGDKKEKDPETKAEGDGDKEKKEPPPDADKDKDKDPPKEEEKKAASIGAELASELLKRDQKIAALEIERMLDKRPDLSESIRKWCAEQDSATVRSFLEAHPKTATKSEDRPAKPTQGATAGAPVLLEGRDREEMDAAMGIRTHAVKMPERREDGSFVLHVVRPGDLRAHEASQQKGV